MVGRPASLYLWDIFHLLSSLPPAEWVTRLQLSSYQLTGTISPIGVAFLVAKAQGCTIPIPADNSLCLLLFSSTHHLRHVLTHRAKTFPTPFKALVLSNSLKSKFSDPCARDTRSL